MPEPRDQFLVQKYTLLPLLARDGMVSCFLLLVLSVALPAADAVFFHQRDAYLPGTVLGFVLAVLLGTWGILCLVLARRRDQDPEWLDLCARTIQAGPFAPGAGPDLPPGTVAHWWDFPTPPVQAGSVAVILLPAAVVLSVFLPRYRAGAKAMEESKQLATAGLESVAATLEDGGCTDVWYSDPGDYYAEYGYSVSGYLQGGEEVFISPGDVKLSAVVNNQGQLIEVNYLLGLDIEKSLEDNLTWVRTQLEQGREVLRKIEIPAKSGDLFAPDLLPDEFAEKMPGVYPYENTYSWQEAADGVTVSTDFCTYPEEEYGEYDCAYIRVAVTCPDAWE